MCGGCGVWCVWCVVGGECGPGVLKYKGGGGGGKVKKNPQNLLSNFLSTLFAGI